MAASVTLNDAEVATLIDALAACRDKLRDLGYTGKDAASALDKICGIVRPFTYELIITDPRAPASRQ